MKRAHVIILAITCGVFCVQVLGDKKTNNRNNEERKIAAVASTKLLTPIYVRNN